MNDKKVIGVRQSVLRIIIPIAVMIAWSLPLIIFHDWIVNTAFGFLPAALAWVVFIILFILVDIIFLIITVFEGAFDVFHIASSPKVLVVLGETSITFNRAIKITDEAHKTKIRDKLALNPGPRWIERKAISADEIWGEDFFGEIEIPFNEIKSLAFHPENLRAKERLDKGKRIRGELIIVTFDEVYVQPIIANLDYTFTSLKGILQIE